MDGIIPWTRWSNGARPLIDDAIDKCSTHSDFRWTIENMKLWNNEGNTPRLIAAVPSDFFRYMEEKYGGQFKVYSGDWTDTWDVHKQTLTLRIEFDY